MIEPVGAKHAYVYLVSAVRGNGVSGAIFVDAADSEDEATGRALRIARGEWPADRLWRSHEVKVIRIDNVTKVGRYDFDKHEEVAWIIKETEACRS